MGSPHDALLLKPGEVAPDGLIGHPERVGQLAPAHAAALSDQIGDDLQAIGRQKGRASGHPYLSSRGGRIPVACLAALIPDLPTEYHGALDSCAR
jgi:hypothetical protein